MSIQPQRDTESTGPSPAERRLAAQIRANVSWSRTVDRQARTAPGKAAFDARFERLADPDGVLDDAERALRAESLRRAHFQAMALKSAQSRRAKREAAAS